MIWMSFYMFLQQWHNQVLCGGVILFNLEFELLNVIKISLNKLIFFFFFCCWCLSKSTQLVIRLNRTGQDLKFRLTLKVPTRQERRPTIFSLHNNAGFRALMLINHSGFRLFSFFFSSLYAVAAEGEIHFTLNTHFWDLWGFHTNSFRSRDSYFSRQMVFWLKEWVKMEVMMKRADGKGGQGLNVYPVQTEKEKESLKSEHEQTRAVWACIFPWCFVREGESDRGRQKTKRKTTEERMRRRDHETE